MAPKKPPAKAAAPPPPEDDILEEILKQNPITKIPVMYWWIAILVAAGILVTILITSAQTYEKLREEDWTPYNEPMNKLKTTMSVGLRDREVLSYDNPLKVVQLVQNLPEFVRKHEDSYAAEKKKYQALFKKGLRSGGNWQIFGWNLYYVSKANKRKTWHDAENFCMSRDSHLTSILNEEEQKYVSSQLNESAWIGLTDENEEGHWEWSDGSRLAVQYWADGNPDGSTDDGEGDKDCTFIESSASELNWNDASCQEPRRWVCKESLEYEETRTSFVEGPPPRAGYRPSCSFFPPFVAVVRTTQPPVKQQRPIKQQSSGGR
ncbi:uncharacterized protein PHA67_023142 [Liasis olivaceus]